jgi:hypothetical protein
VCALSELCRPNGAKNRAIWQKFDGSKAITRQFDDG